MKRSDWAQTEVAWNFLHILSVWGDVFTMTKPLCRFWMCDKITYLCTHGEPVYFFSLSFFFFIHKSLNTHRVSINMNRFLHNCKKKNRYIYIKHISIEPTCSSIWIIKNLRYSNIRHLNRSKNVMRDYHDLAHKLRIFLINTRGFYGHSTGSSHISRREPGK